jgi:C-terminal processing protease CtpA/Prc
MPSDIGYVRVAAFGVSSPGLATSYASSMQLNIRLRDTGGATAWIVDLRGNTGGNMWPMIAGLGPILGDNTLGFFVDPDGIESEWKYRAGLAILNNLTVQAVNNPYTLDNPDPRVAVLTDGRVASSGEAVAIAFKGRPDTRFFGTATCGLATANSEFNVDGATLNLTTASIADRNRVIHGETLTPDEVITDNTQLVQRAIAWLRGG